MSSETPSGRVLGWKKAKELFQAAADLPPENRGSYLEKACGDDEKLRRQVLELLAADEAADGATDGVLESGAFHLGLEVLGTSPRVSLKGQTLGPYRLLHRIGRGGMGEVYGAERVDGQFEQRVAIKLVRPGLESTDALQRFEAERRILGRLEHPFIAQIHDGGVAPDGRPFLVMEFVEGEAIDEYCRRQSLSLDARLRLFRRVASAVQYAHQNLVIHRDLKPSNILITREGTPKLLDFGIAKILDQGDTLETPALTLDWQRRLTPEYASPEQFRGDPITTASDVYSLGVVLFQLLTGRLPFELRGRSRQEVEALIRQEMPVRPSTLVRGSLRRRLRGDLDNIALMALRKEPERRYASADRLSEDLRRHLEALPVLAREDTFAYRTYTMIRRHKAAAAILLLLFGFGIAMSVQSFRLRRAFEKTQMALRTAETEGKKASETLGFLVGILEVADPRGNDPEAVTVREVLFEGSERVRRELGEQPEIQATLMDTIGKVYLQLGFLEEAEPLLQESLETRRRLPEVPLEVATSLHHLGRLRRQQGEWESAEPLIREALELRREHLGEEDLQVAESLNNLGLLYYQMGDYRQATPALEKALEIRRRQLSSPHRSVAESLNNLGLLRFREGDTAAAEPLLREAAAGYEESLGGGHPDLAAALQNLALVLHRKGDPKEAERVLRRVLALQRERLGEDHRDVADTLKNLGALLLRQSSFREAESLLRQALEIHRRTLGPEHPDVAGDLNDLATLFQSEGDLESAEPLFRQALEIRRRALPPGHLSLASSFVSLGSLHLDQGKPATAEPFLRRGLEIRREALPDGHWRIALAENVLGGALVELGRGPEALALLTGSYPVIEEHLGAGHRLTQRAEARRKRGCEIFGSSGGPCAGLREDPAVP